jgi:hypothetical protein
MLSWLLPLIALVILPVALRMFAEDDDPDNGVVHHSGDEDEPPDTASGGQDPDVPLAA